jgi:hypothetical protein
MVRCLYQHAGGLNNCAVQRQLGSVRRKRRIEPRGVKVEERDNENE